MKLKRCQTTGKVRFPSSKSAWLRAGELLKPAVGPKWLRAYKCEHCDQYHLTSK